MSSSIFLQFSEIPTNGRGFVACFEIPKQTKSLFI